MRSALGFSLLLCFLGVCRGGEIDLGSIDQDKAPPPDQIQAPKNDDGTVAVGVHETVKAAVGKDDSKHVYILVNPISPDATARKTWWVQREVTRKGTTIECDCQFGEEDQGKGEYFAIVAVATGDSFDVGQTMESLPEGATYSKLRIVKRR
jgi:hypothetical protein